LVVSVKLEEAAAPEIVVARGLILPVAELYGSKSRKAREARPSLLVWSDALGLCRTMGNFFLLLPAAGEASELLFRLFVETRESGGLLGDDIWDMLWSQNFKACSLLLVQSRRRD